MMKKRILSLALVLTLLLGALPVGAQAASYAYGTRPIFVGDARADYMAEQILSQIPTAGKTPAGKIAAVYDWIETHCVRSDDDATKTYFDLSTLDAKAEAFAAQADLSYRANRITWRQNVSSTACDSVYGDLADYDSNAYLISFASDMMIYRVGNCAHFSALLALLLSHLGYDCRVIAGDYINSSGAKVMHKWNYVLVGTTYYWLDVRMDNTSYAATGRISHTYFMKTDTAAWAKRHSWVHAYTDGLISGCKNLLAVYTAANVIPPVITAWGYCSDWAESYVNDAGGQDLIPYSVKGTDLRARITRLEFAAAALQLYKALSGVSSLQLTIDNPFSDCDDNHVLLACQLGIVNGVGDGKFDPDGTLLREQAVAMMGRVCELVQFGAVADGSQLDLTGAKTFSDRAQTSAYARNYIDYLTACGVIDGVGGGLFAPLGTMTREQAIKVADVAANHFKR